jgi:hypothetical protein
MAHRRLPLPILRVKSASVQRVGQMLRLQEYKVPNCLRTRADDHAINSTVTVMSLDTVPVRSSATEKIPPE